MTETDPTPPADPSEHDQMIGAALSKAKERVR